MPIAWLTGESARERGCSHASSRSLALFGAAAQAAIRTSLRPPRPRLPSASIAGRRPSTRKTSTAVCDLFAPDLRYVVDDILDGTRDLLCGNIDKILATPGLTLRYAEPAIDEILVSGDLAVVRLTWTLTAEKSGVRDVTTEEGMDIFRRAPERRLVDRPLHRRFDPANAALQRPRRTGQNFVTPSIRGHASSLEPHQCASGVARAYRSRHRGRPEVLVRHASAREA